MQNIFSITSKIFLLLLGLVSCQLNMQEEEASHSPKAKLNYLTPNKSNAGHVTTSNPNSNPNHLPNQDLQEQAEVDDVSDKLNEGVSNWFYGQGLGKTALNVGTSIAFPPYLIYLLGNAGLTIFGYEPVELSDPFPEDIKDGLDNAYDTVTSVPGKVTSTVAGEEFYQD